MRYNSATKPWSRKAVKRLCLLCLVILVFIIYCNVRISTYADYRVYDRMAEVPHYHAALVLGTSPTGRNGGLNRFFQSRIKACAELYHAGKIDRIIVSGDNRHKSYNEPAAMKSALILKGVPADVIFLDYAGFRTFDSVIRAKEVFGQSSFVVVSQRFHNEERCSSPGRKE